MDTRRDDSGYGYVYRAVGFRTLGRSGPGSRRRQRCVIYVRVNGDQLWKVIFIIEFLKIVLVKHKKVLEVDVPIRV